MKLENQTNLETLVLTWTFHVDFGNITILWETYFFISLFSNSIVKFQSLRWYFQVNLDVSKFIVIFPSWYKASNFRDVPNYDFFKLICVFNMIIVFPSSFCVQVLFSKLKITVLCNCGWNLPFDIIALTNCFHQLIVRR